MRLMATAFAVAAAFAVCAASTAADAQQRKRKATQRPAPTQAQTVFTSRDETGRTRTRIIVQRRSYLDGGTEVMPGTYAPANASNFYLQRPADGLGNNVITNPPGPIPDPFFLPGKDNPWRGFGP